MKVLLRIIVVLFALLAGVAVTLLLAPVTALGAMMFPPSLQIVEGSSLLNGRALIQGRDASHQLHWHWCPGSSLMGLCIGFNVGSGFASAILKPHWTQLVLKDVRTGNLPPALLGIDPAVIDGRISGTIAQLSMSLASPCPLRALSTTGGELEIAGLRVAANPLENHRLTLFSSNENAPALRLGIAGPQANGELQMLADGNLGGQLELVDPTSGQPPRPLDINLTLPCGRGQ